MNIVENHHYQITTVVDIKMIYKIWQYNNLTCGHYNLTYMYKKIFAVNMIFNYIYKV